MVVDVNKLVEALGQGGGVVKAVTDEETVTVYVMDGHVMAFRTESSEPFEKVLSAGA